MKVSLKVKLSHPNKKFQLGRYSVGIEFKEYELNEKEQKELNTAGPKKWLEVKETENKKPLKKPEV